MNSILKKVNPTWILYVWCVIAGWIVFYKAANLSFTHDESGTFLYLNHLSTLDILFSEEAWRSANNHILNTLLYKLSIGLFGISDFTLRLPNVLAFIGSSVIIFKMIRNQLSNDYAKLVLVGIVFLNPYVLDFYSLCRGYGLGMFFHLGFLYNLWCFREKHRVAYLYVGFFSMALASLSVMTHLVLFPVYFLALLILYYKDPNYTLVRKHMLIAPIVSGTFTLALVIRPISFLINHKEFKHGTGSIWDSIKSLVDCSLQNLPLDGHLWVLDIVTLLTLLLILLAIVKGIRQRKTKFFALSFLILVVLLHVLYFGMDILFPTVRKATLYVPILAVLFADYLNNKRVVEVGTLPKSIILLTPILFFYFLNITSSSIEWNYDRNTKDYINYVHKISNNEPVLICAEWWFNPTAEYYIKTRGLSNLELMHYDKKLNPNDKVDFVIAYEDNMKAFQYFIPIKTEGKIGLYKNRRK